MYKLTIYFDGDVDSPRSLDNVTTMICGHRRYNLGDNNIDINFDDYESWEELEEAIIEKYDPVIIKPLYLYDHSGITISTSPFSCNWDSGQIGYVWISRESANDNLTDQSQKNLNDVLELEVEIYDSYLRGDVYGYMIEKVTTCECCGCENNEVVDSVGGFFGDNFINAMKKHASYEHHHLFDEWNGDIEY